MTDGNGATAEKKDQTSTSAPEGGDEAPSSPMDGMDTDKKTASADEKEEPEENGGQKSNGTHESTKLNEKIDPPQCQDKYACASGNQGISEAENEPIATEKGSSGGPENEKKVPSTQENGVQLSGGPENEKKMPSTQENGVQLDVNKEEDNDNNKKDGAPNDNGNTTSSKPDLQKKIDKFFPRDDDDKIIPAKAKRRDSLSIIPEDRDVKNTSGQNKEKAEMNGNHDGDDDDDDDDDESTTSEKTMKRTLTERIKSLTVSKSIHKRFRSFTKMFRGRDKVDIDEVVTQMKEKGMDEIEICAFYEGFRAQEDIVHNLEDQIKELTEDQNLQDPRRKMMLKAQVMSKSVINSKDQSKDKEGKDDEGERTSCRELSIKKLFNDEEIDKDNEDLLLKLVAAEKKQKKLEKQLRQAGIQIAEDIPYEEAKSRVNEIAKRMNEIGSSDVTHPDPATQARLREEYFKLEQDMERFSTALMLTDEYIKEQEDAERRWEEANVEENIVALKQIRRHMPVNVKNMTKTEMMTEPTPNGLILPAKIVKRFKNSNVLMLLRVDPKSIAPQHPSTLSNLRVTGLTLTERRALHAHLKDVGEQWKKKKEEKLTEQKWTWFKSLRDKFKSDLAMYNIHVEKFGPPGNHPYATRSDPDGGCHLIGKQCPLKANMDPDYTGDYGYTEEAEYPVVSVQKADAEDSGAKAIQEAKELAKAKLANARAETLKKHYKGKVRDVALANGACESIDETIDNLESMQTGWIEAIVDGSAVQKKEITAFGDALKDLRMSILAFMERTGMQLSGKKDASKDKPDTRSKLEVGLCCEAVELSYDFLTGIEDRMKELGAKDGRIRSGVKQLRELLKDLEERNTQTVGKLGPPKPAPSRKLKKIAFIKEEVEKKAKAAKAAAEAEAGTTEEEYSAEAPPRPPMGGLMAEIGNRGRGRGGLLSAIAGRKGRGGGGRDDLMSAIAGRKGRGGGGRNDMLSAIAGRGRGGGGRNDLMSAIAGRGRGRDSGGGRNDLMSAIAARGRGRGGDSGGGRNDLMSAIAARGRGGGGGRNDLMSAIAARGRGTDRSSSGGSTGSSGRGDLMSAIQGRGKRPSASGGRGGLLAAIQARGGGA